jgi:hypothetical protein
LAPNQAVIEDGKPLLPLGLRAPNGLEAFYVPGTDTLFLLGSDNASIGHEYVHALEDQLPAGRMRTMASRTTTDGRIALRMAIEGTAEVLRGEPGEVFRSTSSFTGNALHLQYNVAPRILRQRGDTTLDRALSWAPTSVAAALGLSWAEREGTATPDGCTDQLGITGIATVIAGTPFQTKLTQIARTVAGDSIAYDRTAPVPSVSWHIFLRLSPETDSVRSMLEAALERKVSAPHAFTIHGGLVSDGGPTVLSNSGTP